jgi:hypothetical protein
MCRIAHDIDLSDLFSVLVRSRPQLVHYTLQQRLWQDHSGVRAPFEDPRYERSEARRCERELNAAVDRRIVAMLGARGKTVAKTSSTENENSGISAA